MSSMENPKNMIFKRWFSVVVSCLVALFFILITVFLGVGSANGPGDEIEGHFMAAIMALLSAGMIWLLLSVGVFPGVRVGGGEVVVRSFLGVVRIPVGSVSGVTWHGGLRVHTDAGKSYRCSAFPDSLFSLVIGYRNFRVVARRVERALAEQSQSASTGPVVECTELRGWLFWYLLAGLYSGYWLTFLTARFGDFPVFHV